MLIICYSNISRAIKQYGMKRQVIAFFANIGLFGAGILHLNVGAALRTYTNPLNPTNPRANFKDFITPNAKFIAYCGFFHSIAALFSIFSILFFAGHPRACTCIVNIMLALLTLGCCWMIPVQIMLAVSSWNQINNVEQSVIDFYTSVFIGNIDKIQSFMSVQIYSSLLFLAFSIYNLYYWSTLFVKGKRQEFKERANQ